MIYFKFQLVTCSYFNATPDSPGSKESTYPNPPNDNTKHNYNHCGRGLNCNYKANYVAQMEMEYGEYAEYGEYGKVCVGEMRAPSFW